MQAMAAHNSGGVVIVQVERIVDRGTINARNAHIPGAIVDKIVLAPAEHHWMHLGSPHYDGSLSGKCSLMLICDPGSWNHPTLYDVAKSNGSGPPGPAAVCTSMNL